MKSGCVSPKEKKQRSVSLPVLKNPPAKDGGILKSTTSRWRAAALVLLNLLMIAHIIQWRIAGSTISPIEPSETMYTLQQGAINAGFIFFALAILGTLIFGRFVCGWGCHILALQDFCSWMLKKVGLTPKAFRSRLLVYVPLIGALYMFVWPTLFRVFLSSEQGPLIPKFTNHLVTNNFWETFPSVGVAIPFLFICGFLTVYFLGSKGFCTYACPYGGFFGLADKLAPGKIRVTDACNQCGHCTATCTSNVLVHAEVRQYGMVVDPGCMKCMDCISVCPNEALYFGFGKPAIAIPKAIKKTYSLTWPEEFVGVAVFLGSLLAVRGVYGLVPFLMALGIATITTFLTLKTWKLVRANEMSFYRFSLKSSQPLVIGNEVGRQHFQSDHAAETSILGQINLAHTTASQTPDDLIRSNLICDSVVRFAAEKYVRILLDCRLFEKVAGSFMGLEQRQSLLLKLDVVRANGSQMRRAIALRKIQGRLQNVLNSLPSFRSHASFF